MIYYLEDRVEQLLVAAPRVVEELELFARDHARVERLAANPVAPMGMGTFFSFRAILYSCKTPADSGLLLLVPAMKMANPHLEIMSSRYF